MSGKIFLLHWRLLLAYLIAKVAIVGTFGTAVYVFHTRSLNQQWNQKLLALALSHAASLETIKTKTKASNSLEKKSNQQRPRHNLKDRAPNHPPQHLIAPEQGLEWFNAEGKLLAKVGNVFPNFPLAKNLSQLDWQQRSPIPQIQPQTSARPSPAIETDRPHSTTVYGDAGLSLVQQQGQIRSVTVPTYTPDSNKKTLRLQGYIRASESTAQVEAALKQFLIGLGIAKIIALILSSVSAICLTRLAIELSDRNTRRLRHFSANVSHELRNPLTALCTTVELMQSRSEDLNPSDMQKLAIVASASEQIRSLVEDILFLARSDTAISPLNLEQPPIPLDELLEDLVERFKPQAQSKGINFESRLLSGISVRGDANLLIRLFSNLLENALKYTNEGGRAILSLDKCKRFAIVRLDDTGIGIPAEELPFIFQRLWQVDRQQSQQRESLGLGLAIAEAIVQRHQGKIQVTSKEGVGTCFQVRLPLASNLDDRT
jgi:two-component system, OmpR family, manganese sensing sensor histidine kinase